MVPNTSSRAALQRIQTETPLDGKAILRRRVTVNGNPGIEEISNLHRSDPHRLVTHRQRQIACRWMARLAMPPAGRYPQSMSSWRIRKIAALVAAMVLAAHGVGRPEMAVRSPMHAAVMDMPMPVDAPMPGKCKGCVDDKGVAPAVCAAFCSAVITLPATPAVLLAGPAETLKPGTDPDGTGHVDPPEPYPPRTTFLS